MLGAKRKPGSFEKNEKQPFFSPHRHVELVNRDYPVANLREGDGERDLRVGRSEGGRSKVRQAHHMRTLWAAAFRVDAASAPRVHRTQSCPSA